MEIKYDMYKHYVKCYNEALGVASHKKRLYKNAKAKTHLYTYYGFIYLFSVFTCGFYKFYFGSFSWVLLDKSYNKLFLFINACYNTYLFYFVWTKSSLFSLSFEKRGFLL